MNIVVLAGGNSTEREGFHFIRSGSLSGIKRKKSQGNFSRCLFWKRIHGRRTFFRQI